MLRWFIPVLLAAGLLLAAACGDDDDDDSGDDSGDDDGATPTVALRDGDGSAEAEFFVEWRALGEEITDKIHENSADYPGAFNGDLEESKESFPIYVDYYEEFIVRARDLEAPSAHQELIDSFLADEEAILAIHREREEQLADAETYAEFEAIFADDAEFTSLYNEEIDDCIAFRAVAETYDVTFEGECGEE